MSSVDRSSLPDRAKRMAKRLHHLGQHGPLDVSQLTKAQAITAQLFGFPSWHALQTAERSVEVPPVAVQSVPSHQSLLTTSPSVLPQVLLFQQPEALKKALSFARQGNDPLAVISPFHPGSSQAIPVLSTRDLLRHYDPFALPLGMLRPNEHLLSVLIQWVSMVLLPDYPQEDGLDRRSIEGLLRIMLKESYAMRAPQKDPVRYQPGLRKDVDHFMRNHAQDGSSSWTWWSVMHELMNHGEWQLAAQAQALASPVWSDFVAALNSDSIRELYGNIRRPTTQEPLITWMIRRVSTFCQMVQTRHEEETVSLAMLPEQVWLQVELAPALPELASLSTEARWGLAWLGVEMTRCVPQDALAPVESGPSSGRYLGAFHGLGVFDRPGVEHLFALNSPYAAWHEAHRAERQRRLVWWEGLDLITPDMVYLDEAQLLMVGEGRKRQQGHVLAWASSQPVVSDILRKFSTHENASVHDWLSLQWPARAKPSSKRQRTLS
jgi:hypothetical protein